jgi:uroporphyrinogen decarboxylase
MTKRDVVRTVLAGEAPPYVPWSMGFTVEAAEKLRAFYAPRELEDVLDNHLGGVGSGVGFFTDLGDDHLRDVFGVVWDRTVDKDIGIVVGQVLPEPTLAGYAFPDPLGPIFFDGVEEALAAQADRYRIFSIGFSLYERAWTMRGMAELMMDFYDHPGFVHELLNTIADWNITQVRKAVAYDIDAVYFGDDWGQQRGLQMGPRLWREFIYPPLKRMYAAVKEAGKAVFIHSCGDVDELFDDLIAIGLDCFNPFQPEVMDVTALMRQYRGRLSFHGGMSTQRTLPYGTVDEVVSETKRLLAAGADGNYVFAPAHSVEGDVPVENMVAMIDTVQAQPGYRAG